MTVCFPLAEGRKKRSSAFVGSGIHQGNSVEENCKKPNTVANNRNDKTPIFAIILDPPLPER